MDAAKVIAQCFDAIDAGIGIDSLIADTERKAGNHVVRPGEARWLPLALWEPGTVCSITPNRTARLVLLYARKQGEGAFGLLLHGLALEGLSPDVIDPTREFGYALSRRNWRCKIFNTADGQERVWRPRNGVHAVAKEARVKRSGNDA